MSYLVRFNCIFKFHKHFDVCLQAERQMEAVLFLVDKISLFLWVLLCGRKYLNASSQKRMQFLFLFPPLPQHPFDSPYFRSLARWIADDCVFARPLDSPNFRSALGGSPMMTYLLGRSTIQRGTASSLATQPVA